MSNNVKVSYDFLPVEIVTDILLRLPTKAIITCICVCKTWKSIIQNPTFVPDHLNLSIKSNNNLILLRLCSKQGREVYALHNDDDDDFTKHTTLAFPFQGPHVELFNGVFRLVGTCNGLVCFSNDLLTSLHRFFLWNPCVRKYLRLPYPNFTKRTHEFDEFIGFGFDPKTNDYKVVRVMSYTDILGIKMDRPEVEVYSLATGEWRMVTTALPPICTLIICTLTRVTAHGSLVDQKIREPQAFVNGAFHWLAFRMTDDQKYYPFVLVFDLGDEVFREILLPELPGHESLLKKEGASLLVYGNSIALFEKGSQNIWVMKEYGVASSWTKVLTIAYQGREEGIPRAIGFRRNGEVVWALDEGQLASQDFESQEMKDLRITSYKYTFVDSYVESLLFLDKATNSAIAY
jgi:F-box interacting protein